MPHGSFVAGGDLPIWAQQVGALAGTVAVAVGVAWNERRKKKGSEPEDGPVIATAVIGRQATDTLASAIDSATRAISAHSEENHADNRKLVAAMENLVDELRRNTAASQSGAVTPSDLMTLIAQLRTKP